MHLLSVDWDYFFPMSNDPCEASLWDWGAREGGDLGDFFQTTIWHIRAAQFLASYHPLPGTSGEETRFWGRFHFSPKCQLYYSDSHAQAALDTVWPGITRVTNFDAHHDGGYGTTLRKIAAEQWVDCSNWTAFYHLALGARIQTIYPAWKHWAMQAEPRPAVPMVRRIDDGIHCNVTIDRVFVCRSGAWTPPWLDCKFTNFVAACPIRRHTPLDIVEREFDATAAHAYGSMLKDLATTMRLCRKLEKRRKVDFLQ